MSNPSLLPVSVCIVTNTINDTLLKSITVVQAFADEICIGFDGSEKDITAELRNMARVKCWAIIWEGYSTSKNRLAEKASNNWILSLDSDEVMDQDFCHSIKNFDFSIGHQVGQIRRSYFLGNKLLKYGDWGRNKVVRLYNRLHAKWNKDAVHEGLESLDGSPLTKVLINGYMQHYTAQSMEEVAQKNNLYADLVAQKYFDRGRSVSHLHIVAAPVINFVVGYVLYAGFLDGADGLRLAFEGARYTHKKYQSLHRLCKNASKNKQAVL